MESVGLRELRQDASTLLLRRVEGGEEIMVTVAGRPSARPVRAASPWRTWDEIRDLFDGPADPDWAADRDQIDQSVADPWLRP